MANTSNNFTCQVVLNEQCKPINITFVRHETEKAENSQSHFLYY